MLRKVYSSKELVPPERTMQNPRGMDFMNGSLKKVTWRND